MASLVLLAQVLFLRLEWISLAGAAFACILTVSTLVVRGNYCFSYSGI
jgi:hypothetical protein